MNYRQWKKNYKKKHGYNPPISEDKRKRAKIEARYVYQLPEIVIDEFIPNFLKGIADACEMLSNGFKNIAESFKTSADNFSRKGR
jgi:hypothetical protein